MRLAQSLGVIPAKAGIQILQTLRINAAAEHMDSRLRGNDNQGGTALWP